MYRIKVSGVVQGVGFRPFIYRKAVEAKARGEVRNTGDGVLVLTDRDFISGITDWPPLARVDDISIEYIDGVDDISSNKSYEIFRIMESSDEAGSSDLPADIYTCSDCEKDMKRRHDRRYGYYFTTCTNCGPRFSMIEDYPYDRKTTSMKDFEMCESCRKEYMDPLDRRYHAETIACKDCGPRLLLKYNHLDIGKQDMTETLKEAVKLLISGVVLSIKGVGGFHMCCIARKRDIEKLRFILGRPFKPFALMVKDVLMAKGIAQVSEMEEKLLLSKERPVVVLKKRRKDDYELVSELDSIGIMLPYTALHHLLFEHLDIPLVMTSANYPGEPISIDEDVGEYFLTHERRIVNRCDDSVIKTIDDKRFFLRRSRGFVPLPIRLPFEVPDTLALGAMENVAVCLASKKKSYLSSHIGNVSRLSAFESFKEITEKMMNLTRIRPRRIVCDLHPQFMTTRYAKELAARYNATLIQLQHHKAHLAGCAAEHSLSEYVGIACDGFGYGDDGNAWGGEVFRVKDGIFTRIGRLEYQPMIGGDSSTREAKKMLFAILSKRMKRASLIKAGIYNRDETDFYLNILKEGYNIVQTSSTGRILDSVASMIGICDHAEYEGRPAMLLESCIGSPLRLKLQIEEENGIKVLMTSDVVKSLYTRYRRGMKKEKISATIHDYLARGLYEIAGGHGLPIVFSGGVSYNSYFVSFLSSKDVLFHKDVPPGDGGLSFGQIALSAYMK